MPFWIHCPDTALAAAGIVGQWDIEPDARIVKFDRAGAKYWFDDADLAGLPLPLGKTFALIHPDDLKLVRATIMSVWQDGGPLLIERRILSPHLGLRTLQIRGRYGLDDRGRMVGRGVIIDITGIVGAPFRTSQSGLPLSPMPFAPLFHPSAEAAPCVGGQRMPGWNGRGALDPPAGLLPVGIEAIPAALIAAGSRPRPDRS